MRIVTLLTLTYWLLLTALLWSPQGLVSSAVPRVVLGSVDDLALHLLCFAVLGLLVCVCRWPIRVYVLVFTLAVYAVGAESMQVFAPGRSASLLDCAANLLGIAAGLSIGATACVVTRNDNELRSVDGESSDRTEDGIRH